MLKPDTFVESLGYFQDAEGNIFQVLNQDGTAWDEEASAKQMNDFLGGTPNG